MKAFVSIFVLTVFVLLSFLNNRSLLSNDLLLQRKNCRSKTRNKQENHRFSKNPLAAGGGRELVLGVFGVDGAVGSCR